MKRLHGDNPSTFGRNFVSFRQNNSGFYEVHYGLQSSIRFVSLLFGSGGTILFGLATYVLV